MPPMVTTPARALAGRRKAVTGAGEAVAVPGYQLALAGQAPLR